MIVDWLTRKKCGFDLSNYIRLAVPVSLLLSIDKNTTSSSDSKELEKEFETFSEDFKNAFGEKKRTATTELLWKEDEASKSQSCTITLEGELLKCMHQVVSYGDQSYNLKLKVLVECSYYDSTLETDVFPVTILADELIPANNHNLYKQENIPVPAVPPEGKTKSAWPIQISLCIENYIPKSEVWTPDILNVNQNILKEKKFCDVEILCEGGERIPCHRTFLCVSPVFAANLESKLKENSENILDLENITFEAVTALLQFIYCGHIFEGVRSCHIAYALLVAADMYDIPKLWLAITKIMLAKSHTWYTVDLAVEIFSFVCKCQQSEAIMVKKTMIEVLMKFPQDVESSECFAELFGNPVSREFVKLILESKNSAQ